MPARGLYDLPAMCLQAMGLRFFKKRLSADDTSRQIVKIYQINADSNQLTTGF